MLEHQKVGRSAFTYLRQPAKIEENGLVFNWYIIQFYNMDTCRHSDIDFDVYTL